MKPQPIYLLLLLISISCRNAVEVKATPQQNTKNSFSVNDSLKKYKDSDSISIMEANGLFTLNIGRANEHSYAFYIVGDSTTVFYQKNKAESWAVTDTLRYGFFRSYTKTKDINGDGYLDAILSSATGVAANSENTVFIYNAKTVQFKHNSNYDLPNIAYNNDGKFIQSSWFGSAMNCSRKEIYSISGDSIIFKSGISICPDQDKATKATLTYYEMKNGERVPLKTLMGEPGTLWESFDNTFWNSQND
jgi:hypothetical protein